MADTLAIRWQIRYTDKHGHVVTITIEGGNLEGVLREARQVLRHVNRLQND